ncbi:MAG: class I SAM-dependent methyltransferase [Bacteriovorax sp.]|nr:class I SAM-dependent methyltransferase [Bacteriovorax sp.]
MNKLNIEINDVTDTAIWVASYRAEETERKDALFHDPYAHLLVGSTGTLLATRTQGSRYTAWSVVIRTCIIDKFILDLIAKNIDTVVNLGAGLDTRPYRLDLPKNLRWIEVDFPKIIDLKEEKLKDEIPKCQLERIKLDLSKTIERDKFFAKISSVSNNVLILTEGVVPYLSNEDVKDLAESLHQYENFRYWVTEYYSPEILEFLRTPKRIQQMRNAPFLFYPDSWFKFFKNAGWSEADTKYLGEESEKLGRTPPTPGRLKNENQQSSESIANSTKKYLGYSIFNRSRELS